MKTRSRPNALAFPGLSLRRGKKKGRTVPIETGLAETLQEDSASPSSRVVSVTDTVTGSPRVPEWVTSTANGLFVAVIRTVPPANHTCMSTSIVCWVAGGRPWKKRVMPPGPFPCCYNRMKGGEPSVNT